MDIELAMVEDIMTDFFANANKNIVKIGLCFDLQIVSEVPRDIYDIPVDYIITEDRIIKTIISS